MKKNVFTLPLSRPYRFSTYKIIIPVLSCILVFSWIKLSYAQKFSINCGLGTVQIKSNTDQLLSSSKSTIQQLGLNLDFEKKDFPILIYFNGVFFNTNESSEKWHKKSSSSLLQENSLNTQGITLDALGYYLLYDFRYYNNSLSIRPFLGGGLVYRRYNLKRKNFIGDMIKLDISNNNNLFYLGGEDILSIGGMPYIGAFLSFPKKGMDIKMDFGYGFLSSRSNIDFQITSYFVKEKTIYPIETKTSSSYMLGRLQLLKNWESYSISIGYKWEKTIINNKNILLYDTGINKFYLPFPELETEQNISFLIFSYIF